jgi:peptide/nickel transport system permease protein
VSGSSRSPAALFGLAVAAGLVSLRLAAVFVDTRPERLTSAALLGPSRQHPLGTDQLGRDLVLRLVDGVEAFFGPGLLAALVAVLLGTLAGTLVAWRPERPVAAATRGALALVGAWPRLVLVVVAVAIFTARARDPAAWAGVRLFVLGALVGLSFVPPVAGALAERILHLRREQFVAAARAHGVPEGRILGRHVLWANCRHLLLREAAAVFGSFLLVECALSYLGHYGVPAPRPSWGNVLADLRFAVSRSGGLLRPENWGEAGPLAALGRAISEGSLLGLLAPTLLIVGTTAGLVALADTLRRVDAS